ncbi:MAG TPA: tripartite tricarboxylate transporter substrate binding protein [Burkholderiales bacterium]|nr:tripartite tricarboxylate transporter substrate binding protein [Burkholderiales bacterium]
MRTVLTLIAAATLAAWTPAGWAQGSAASFPARPVRMIVGFTPGGGTDIIARIVAQKLGERWGQPVLVENRAGAGGNIGTEVVARSSPDGYTILMAFSSHASNPALYGKLPFDINKDFSSITLIGTAPMVVTASPALPAKTLAELIEYARSRPGAVKFGSSGVGTPVHLAGELMMQLTGIKMVHVPYKGIAPAMTAILAGEIEITYVAVLTGLQYFKAGRLSPLAVAGRSRYPALPDVPTAAEAGLNGYEIEFWYALLGPAGMPAPLVARIQRDAAAVLTTPEMKESLLAQGCIAVGSGPEELSARIRSDYELWSRVIKTAGVKLE